MYVSIQKASNAASLARNRPITHNDKKRVLIAHKVEEERNGRVFTKEKHPKPQKPSLNPSHLIISFLSILHNPINPLGDEEASETKPEQAGGNAPEPNQVALVLLPGDPDVHAPHARDDVHGQDDGAEDGELAKDVGGLLGALVHTDVDLGEVVAVGAGEEAVEEMC